MQRLLWSVAPGPGVPAPELRRQGLWRWWSA